MPEELKMLAFKRWIDNCIRASREEGVSDEDMVLVLVSAIKSLLIVERVQAMNLKNALKGIGYSE